MLRVDGLGVVPVAILVLALAGSAQAADPNMAVLRAESLDAIGADMQRVVRVFDVELTGDQLLAPVMGALGVSDTRWLDRSRPLAVALPVDGMALGFRGIVAALPVETETSFDSLLEQLGGAGARPDGHGVYSLQAAGQPLALLLRDDYLIVGGAPSLVLGFDLRSALDRGGAPAGNLALDVDIESIRPMAQMGLAMGRQMLAQQAMPSVAAGEDNVQGTEVQTNEDPAAIPGFDSQNVMAMLGLYFDLLQDLVNNTDRLQLSLEVAAEDAVVHLRLIPRGASTLEGLLKAQKGGLPRLAAHIDQQDAIGVWAGQIRFTPAFVEAVHAYTEKYVEAMRQLGSVFEGTMGPGWFAGLAEAMAESTAAWTDCVRGDFAGAVNFEPEGGFRFTQVIGAADAEACRSMFTKMGQAVAALPAGADGETYLSLTENAFQYGDVKATRQETKLMMPPGEDYAEVREMISTWFGGDVMVSYFGVAGDVVVNVTGADSEERLKALIDRVAAKKSTPSITPETFAPLESGPGVFGFMDVGQMARMIQETLPGVPGSGDAPLFGELAPGRGRVVFGARFDAQGLNLELAVPMALIEAFGKLFRTPAATIAPGDPQG